MAERPESLRGGELMGYGRSSYGPDTPRERAIHVFAVAVLWVSIGWVVSAILARFEDTWLVFYLFGF